MNADQNNIKALIERWHRATAKGELDTVLTLMSDDVTFLVPGKPPMKGKARFEEGLRGLLRTHRIQSTGDVQEIGVSGDLAYALTLLTVRIIDQSSGEERVRSGHAMSVFRRQCDGSWLLVRDANLLPPAG